MASLDVTSLREALPTTDSSQANSKPPPLPKPVPVKVLSWNIHGAGEARARNRLVPAVVRATEPDVLLLQETKTDTLVRSLRPPGRRYVEVRAGEKAESRVLYDDNTYAAVSNDEKLFPGEGGGAKSLSDVLELSIERVFPEREERELRRGRAGGMRELFKKRISIVGLKRRGPPESPTVVFVSFHNVNTSQGAAVRNRAANGFCEMVRIVGELTGCVVVAGADLNLHMATPTPTPTILPYTPTLRRSGVRKIDYFLLSSPPDRVTQSHVTALDFTEARDDTSNPLHEAVRELLRPTLSGKSYTIVDYGRSVDHDPLVCELEITIQSPSSSPTSQCVVQ